MNNEIDIRNKLAQLDNDIARLDTEQMCIKILN
jgi:hypothetical protein